MGFFRMLYREARDILGLKPPPENENQRAERICDEVKGDLGGKKTKTGDNWTLTTAIEGRGVVIVFESAGNRALITVASELGDGPHFLLVTDAGNSTPPGRHRRTVGTALYLDAPDTTTLNTFETMWKALPTGTRGNLSSLLSKNSASLAFDGTTFAFTPEVALFVNPGARGNVRSQATTLARLVGEIEQAWQAL